MSIFLPSKSPDQHSSILIKYKIKNDTFVEKYSFRGTDDPSCFDNAYLIKQRRQTLLKNKNAEYQDDSENYGYHIEPINGEWPEISNNYKVAYVRETEQVAYPENNKLHFFYTKNRFVKDDKLIEIKRTGSDDAGNPKSEKIIKAISVGNHDMMIFL